jgi:hypothetical protein
MDSDRRSRQPRPASVDPERRALIQRLVTVIWDDIKDVPMGRQTADSYAYDEPVEESTLLMPGKRTRLRRWGHEHNNGVAVIIAAVGFVIVGAVGLWPGEVFYKCLIALGLLVILGVATWLLNSSLHWSQRSRVILIGSGSMLCVLVGIIITMQVLAGVGPRSSPPTSATQQDSSVGRNRNEVIPPEAAIATTDSRPAQPTMVQGHVVVNVSPAKLLGLCSGYTSLQCDKIFSEYTNKWIRVRGSVDDVGEGVAVVHVPDKKNAELGYNTVIIYFDQSQHEEVVHLRAKDDIIVLGKIGDTAMGILDLQDAELVRNNTANARTP